MLEQKQKISQQKGLIISFLELESFRACEQKKKKDTEKQSIGNFSAKIVLDKSRHIHIECSKQFNWNLYFYVSGQSGPFWPELKLL